MSGVRTNLELTMQVSESPDLDDFVFERDTTSLFDSLEHACSGLLSLTALEQNHTINFGAVAEARVVYLESDGDLDLSFGGTAGLIASLTGSGGTFPTSFVGGETFGFTVDGVSVAGAFTSGAQTLQQCLNQLNAAAMLAGLSFVPFSSLGGQVKVSGHNASASGHVAVTVARSVLGFASTSASASGTDPNGASAPMYMRRPIDTTSPNASGTSYLLATVRCASLVITNATDAEVQVRYALVGDVLIDVC